FHFSIRNERSEKLTTKVSPLILRREAERGFMRAINCTPHLVEMVQGKANDIFDPAERLVMTKDDAFDPGEVVKPFHDKPQRIHEAKALKLIFYSAFSQAVEVTT